jgi:hypothetical protein
MCFVFNEQVLYLGVSVVVFVSVYVAREVCICHFAPPSMPFAPSSLFCYFTNKINEE